MKLKLSDLEEAYLFTEGGYGEDACYLCKQSGRIFYVSEYGDSDSDLPDDLEESDQYLILPSRDELDLGSRLVHRFVKQKLPQHVETVYGFFSRKGAYQRFKGLLSEIDRLDDWYAYESNQIRTALNNWCDANGVKLADGHDD